MNLRPEAFNGCPEDSHTVSDKEAIRLIYQAVAKRRSLAQGKLHKDGKDCAVGAFFADNPLSGIHTALVNKVAKINDATPRATPKQRWKRVMKWLREQVAEIEEAQ